MILAPEQGLILIGVAFELAFDSLGSELPTSRGGKAHA
jgi:hypothetical protein